MPPPDSSSCTLSCTAAAAEGVLLRLMPGVALPLAAAPGARGLGEGEGLGEEERQRVKVELPEALPEPEVVSDQEAAAEAEVATDREAATEPELLRAGLAEAAREALLLMLPELLPPAGLAEAAREALLLMLPEVLPPAGLPVAARETLPAGLALKLPLTERLLLTEEEEEKVGEPLPEMLLVELELGVGPVMVTVKTTLVALA